MNLKDIALLNLRRRKAKAAFVLAGLLIGVATMVALVGLAEALTHEINHKLEKYGANILVTPRSDQLSLTYEGMSLGGFSFETKELKETDLEKIRHIKNAGNLAAVGPMVLGVVRVGQQEVLLSGVDFEASEILKPWWKVEGAAPGPGQVVLGSEAARVLGLATGQELVIQDRRLTVSGLLTPTGSQDDGLIFSQVATAQELLGKQGLVSMVEVAALCKDCPVEDMVEQISEVLPTAKVVAIQSVVKGRMETLKHFKSFGMGVSGLVALVGSLVVLVTMMASVKERTQEIGIFRAIGFRQSHVMRVVLLEAALLSLAAGVLGYLLGLGAGELALPLFSQGHGAHVAFDPWLAGGALVLALVVGLAASLYPSLMAARMDPHEALRTL
ncbi:MAG: ABC transporter permease [Desulfarculus sp.]|nr:ABC transporter permease [Desulfarculus sp.]